MAIILPSDDELNGEFETPAGDRLDAEAALRDSAWCFTFAQTIKVDPADVHGA